MSSRAPRPVVFLALFLLGQLPGCGGSTSSPAGATATDSCSTLGKVSFVRDTLQNIYFWYQQLPNPDPAGFASPEARSGEGSAGSAFRSAAR